MKHIIPILLIALICAACNKPATTEKHELTHEDSILLNVFRAMGDSTYSCIDYKDAFYELLDTMQTHVESHPNENVRIGAQSLALDLVGLCTYGEFLTPEEDKFFYDSLLLRFSDILSTWYCPHHPSYRISDWRAEPILSHCIVFRYNDQGETNHIISLDVYITPDLEEFIVVTLPKEAEQLASITFMTDNAMTFDKTSTFHLEDAQRVLEETEENGQMIVFGQDLIDAMLLHVGMFIGYIGDEEGNTLEERFHDAHLTLTKFHEQYSKVKSCHSIKGVDSLRSNNVYEEDTRTPHTFQIKNEIFPIWITPQGHCYIIRSTRAGDQYKQFLDKEICLQLCAELNIEYKE